MKTMEQALEEFNGKLQRGNKAKAPGSKASSALRRKVRKSGDLAPGKIRTIPSADIPSGVLGEGGRITSSRLAALAECSAHHIDTLRRAGKISPVAIVKVYQKKTQYFWRPCDADTIINLRKRKKLMLVERKMCEKRNRECIEGSDCGICDERSRVDASIISTFELI